MDEPGGVLIIFPHVDLFVGVKASQTRPNFNPRVNIMGYIVFGIS